MKPTWLFRYVVTYFRFWAPLRLVQAYGVFPPNSAPPQRWLVTYEATDDGGRTWHPLPAPYVALALTHVAPYHPRLTHNLFYESECPSRHPVFVSCALRLPPPLPASTPQSTP